MYAEPLEVSVGELTTAIDNLDDEADALQRMVLQKIQNALDDADLELQSGDLLFSETSENLVLDDDCNSTEVRTLTTKLTLASDTRLTLSLSSINEPVRLSVNLSAQVDSRGRARQSVGIQLGSCQELGSDNFDFIASADAQMSLTLELRLNPSLDTLNEQLVLRPLISLDGTLETSNVRADVDDSLFRGLLESLLEDEIEQALDDSEVSRIISELEQELVNDLNTDLDDGALIISLPAPTDEQVKELYSLLSRDGDFSLTMGYLQTKRFELLTALILGDDDRIDELLSTAVLCEGAAILQVPLRHEPVYKLDVEGCVAAQIPYSIGFDVAGLEEEEAATTNWYPDASCQVPLDYLATSSLDFCTTFLDTERLGNAASFPEQLQQWTLSPGTRFDISALPLGDKLQPFTQRLNYKTVSTQMGECALEMRVYMSKPFAAGMQADQTGESRLRPLIAFHGGSWQRRSSGALGIEAFATQFVDQGFVVFAPFYRLIGDAEGSVDCNNASLDDVLLDASDALTWVLQQSHQYGASGKPVLFGQSAGGHLAAMLAVERSAEVDSAVLFYAPVDFTEFARQLISGEIVSEAGEGILEAVVGSTLETVDLASPLMQRNSLPARIQIDTQASPAKEIPPFFLLHGKEDTVLPFNQSVRLCNALAGRTLNADISAPGSSAELRNIVSCGDAGSEMHLIKEGEHTLDLCIADQLCLAGSPASAELTSDSVGQMLQWITSVNQQEQPVEDAPGSQDATSEINTDIDGIVTADSGGGKLAWLDVLGLLFALMLMSATNTRLSDSL